MMLDIFKNPTIATNICVFGGGLMFGYLLRHWFRKGARLEANGKNAFMEESFSDLIMGDHKLVLVVQNGLKMGKGKIAAQCSHASVMAYMNSSKTNPEALRKWLKSGQRKVVVKVDNEEVLLEVASEARRKNLVVSMVCDAGHTQVAAGSRTVVGIGPGPENLIDSVTGHLKLL